MNLALIFLPVMKPCAWCGRGVLCGTRSQWKPCTEAGGNAHCTERMKNSQGVSLALWETWETWCVLWLRSPVYPFALKPTGTF